MGAIDCYPNSKLKLQSMFLHRKSTNLISKAKEVALVAHPHIMPSPTIRSSAANLTRTMAAINKDGIGVDPHELDAIFEQKRSLRSKVRKALKNMDPILRSQEGSVRLFVSSGISLLWTSDNAIQNIVVESSWFKASKSLCAYVSSPALLEVGTSRIISEVLSSSAKERKKLYVPRVEDRNSNMKMLMISSVKDLIEKSMNILEPALVDSDGNQREDDWKWVGQLSLRQCIAISSSSYFAKRFCHLAANYLEVSDAVMQASDPVDLFIVPGNCLHPPI
ncbi:hypothetical protein Goklo_007920 [Gossypium klotzschianum]|uniref:Uncharacterized protein n=1 Tax=Gossypium klotzschianum TaxID=34286 RepID=A0A7J8UYQ5_9ROSI|nr:hypothetical protein [Gossypium klotzschianum]